MMDVLERLIRVARAHLNAGRETSWQDDGMDREESPHYDAGFRSGDAGFRSGDAGFRSGDAGFHPDEKPREDSPMAGYYANLEVPYGADLETVRQSWRRLVKKYHPDLHGDDPEKRRIANELTAELTRAYRELEKALQTDGRSR